MIKSIDKTRATKKRPAYYDESDLSKDAVHVDTAEISRHQWVVHHTGDGIIVLLATRFTGEPVLAKTLVIRGNVAPLFGADGLDVGLVAQGAQLAQVVKGLDQNKAIRVVMSATSAKDEYYTLELI